MKSLKQAKNLREFYLPPTALKNTLSFTRVSIKTYTVFARMLCINAGIKVAQVSLERIP
jgi:hypothetical protein